MMFCNDILRRVFGHLVTIVGNDDLARDLLHDAVLKAIEKQQDGRYEEQEKFGQWFMRLAHNTAMDFLKRKRLSLSSIPTQEIADVPLDDVMEHEAQLQRMEKMLALLTTEQRKIIEMHYQLGMSFKKISKATGVNINTLLAQSRRAVVKLRKLMKIEL